MTIVMPTAPAPAAPVSGRVTVSSGTGDAFAATLAAATGEPATPASDQDTTRDGATDPHTSGGDRTVPASPTFCAPVGDASPAAGTATEAVQQEAAPADAAPGIAAGDTTPAPTGGATSTGAPHHAVPAEAEHAASTGDAAPAGAHGVAEHPGPEHAAAAVTSGTAAAAAGVRTGPAAGAGHLDQAPTPAPTVGSSALPAAEAAQGTPAGATSTAAGVTSGAPAAEPTAVPAAVVPPAEASEGTAPTRAATSAPAGMPVTATAAPGAGDPSGLPDASVPAGERAAPGPAGAVETAVRADVPSVRAESVARTEQTAPPPSSPPTPQPVSTQLSSALARLRTAPEGTHVLHMRVDPEDLGPVRVTAHIAADGVRIELFGVTDAARDALRGALSELRRDLAATGLHADLDLAAEDGPHERPERAAGERRAESQPRPATDTTPTPSAPVPTGGLDLLA